MNTKLFKRRHARSAQPSMLPLEPRQYLAGTSVGVYATFNASEADRLTTGRGEFVIKRPTGSTSQPLTLQYYVRNTSTAVQGVDFKPLSGTVTIPVGKRSAAINVWAIDDFIDEPDETIVVSLKTTTIPVVHRSATVTLSDNDLPQPADWFGDTRRYRRAFAVDAGSFARSDQPIDVGINFTDVLTERGASGSIILNSIKVVEVSANGSTLVDGNVPFQFDTDSNFNPSSNAAGNLVILATGATNANATRYYQVYFDTVGAYSAPSFNSLVNPTDNVTDEGYSAVKIETGVATYYYQKAEGGFSSILDSDGNDWVSWHSSGGSAGDYRGIPNLGAVGFHPGRDHDITTQIVSSGPLKTILESTDGDGNHVRWEFYPTFARMTVLSMNQNYWFLYEGTPGGSVDGNDTVVRSDGTTTASNVEWTDSDGLGTSNGEEWAYFRDSAVGANGRYLFAVHDTVDSIRDTYWEMEGNMTVFGFGRYTSFPDHNVSNALIPGGNNLNDVFTIGLANGGADFSATSAAINGIYRQLTVTLGSASSVNG